MPSSSTCWVSSTYSRTRRCLAGPPSAYCNAVASCTCTKFLFRLGFPPLQVREIHGARCCAAWCCQHGCSRPKEEGPRIGSSACHVKFTHHVSVKRCTAHRGDVPQNSESCVNLPQPADDCSVLRASSSAPLGVEKPGGLLQSPKVRPAHSRCRPKQSAAQRRQEGKGIRLHGAALYSAPAAFAQIATDYY